MLFNEAWVIGFLMDISGAMLMLGGLSLAPVSVIQPVSGCGLAIPSISSYFYQMEMMNAIDWVGITLVGIGTIGVGAGEEEQEASSILTFHFLWLAFVVSFMFVGPPQWTASYSQTTAAQRKEQELDCICDIKNGIRILGAGFFQVTGSSLHFNQYML